MRTFAFLILGLLACSNPKGYAALPTANTPREAATTFVNALRAGQCDQAISMTTEPLKGIYQNMIAAQNFTAACENWRFPYLPYERFEYSFEEGDATKKKVWMRFYKDVQEFEVVSIELEQKSGRWWVVGL